MNFCSLLQKQLGELHPNRVWLVSEHANPSTSVIILAQGHAVPGEFIATLLDANHTKLAELVVRGQEFCDYVKTGSEADYARELAGKLIGKAG